MMYLCQTKPGNLLKLEGYRIIVQGAQHQFYRPIIESYPGDWIAQTKNLIGGKTMGPDVLYISGLWSHEPAQNWIREPGPGTRTTSLKVCNI